jgi:hypothetical protein
LEALMERECSMSRTEELRAKFRKIGEDALANLDNEFISFSVELNRFVSKNFKASTMHSEYERNIYGDYKIDKPVDLVGWFNIKTKDKFRSIFSQPEWIGEPMWCFHEGEPLEFLHQFSDEEGVIFYVFRGTRAINLGNSDEIYNIPLYKMCAQTNIGNIKFTDNLIS